MRTTVTIMAAITLVIAASCGGGDTGNGGQPAQPTSNQTKAATAASVTEVTATTAAALRNALQNIPTGAPMVLSAKDTFTVSVNYTYHCPISGVAVATGTVSPSCSSNDSTVTCTLTNNTLQVEFQDCEATETVDTTVYTMFLNDTVSTTFSGSGTGGDNGLLSLSFNGTISGTASVSGDVTGTVDLSNITYQGSGVPPTVTCSGTAAVTTNSTTETCTVLSDCSGCQL